MDFKILGDIDSIETIASGSGIREIARLRKRHGRVAGVSARDMLKCVWATGQ
jgi:hypothetical protein